MQPDGERVNALGSDPARPGVAGQSAADHSQVGERDHQPDRNRPIRDQQAGPHQRRFTRCNGDRQAGLFKEEQQAHDGDAGNVRGHLPGRDQLVS